MRATEIKRILFICNYFAPDNTIAAVRISKLAKYLKQSGYDVEVIAEKRKDEIEDELLRRDTVGIKIHYACNSDRCIRFYELYKKITKGYREKRFQNLDNRKKVNPRTGKIEFYPFETLYPVIGSFDYIVKQIKQFDLYRSVKKRLAASGQFDYVMTSYGDSFSYFAGKYYHKCHKDVSWIFDIRDAICRYKFTPDYVKWIPQAYERYIWKNADCIIGVSRGICRRVPKSYRRKTYCLTNGFDRSDRQCLGFLKTLSQNMVFVYTGSMYGGLQDISVFFKAVRKLIVGRKLDEDRVEFHFAGNGSAYEVFKSQAEQYQLAGRCFFNGRLSHQEALQLQQNADILLLASYDYKDNTGGIITGKLLEYMSAEKPVIAIVTGDIENSEVKKIIRKTNIGITYEESGAKTDFEKLTEYIEKQYVLFMKGAELHYCPNEKEIAKYDYKNICKRFLTIIDKIENRSAQK